MKEENKFSESGAFKIEKISPEQMKERLLPGTPVLFRNLLEENGADICHGKMMTDGFVKCLCGCEGRFEPEDVEIMGIARPLTS